MNRPTYWLCFGLVMLTITAFVVLGRPMKGGMEVMMVLIGVPRLHDIGRSEWFVGGVIAAEAAIIFGALFAGASTDTLEITAAAVFLGVAILGIWLGLIPSDPETNKWGDRPDAGVRFRKPQSQSSSS